MGPPGSSWTIRAALFVGLSLIALTAQAAELTRSAQASGGPQASAGYQVRSAVGEPAVGLLSGSSKILTLGFLATDMDSTPPTTPVVTDDGVWTASTTILHATWTSSDAESGIAEYQYQITRDSAAGTVIVAWTSTSATASVTKTGLTLTNGKKYYFSVKAKNRAGLWSSVGSSDGIVVDKNAPVILGITSADGTAFTEGNLVTITVTASDVDGDPLEYQFLVDGAVARSWSSSAMFTWDTAGKIKSHTVTVQVRDGLGRQAESQIKLFGYRRPVPPPN